MKKMVCGIGNVVDVQWKTVYANNQIDALKKAHKYCEHVCQCGFTIVVGEFE